MGKGSARFVAPRLTIAAVAALFVVALGALPASAYAAAWMSAYPVGTMHVQPSIVAVDVFSSAKLNATTAQITIAGVPQKTFVTNVGAASGHWAATETQNPATGVWTVAWTWVADTGGATKATLYCYPAALSEGAKLVAVSVKDCTGAALSYSWTFTIGIPPVVGTPSPASGSTLIALTPAITVPVSDNTGVASWSASFNGTPATASLASGVLTVVPTSALSNDATTSLALTVSDAAGNSTTRIWSYYVQSYLPMSGDYTQCTSCHPTDATAEDMGPDCALCHTARSGYAAHTGTVVGLHTRATLPSDCVACHVSALLSEHGRWGATCATCHAPTASATVKAAIASGSSACVSCHDGHGSQHPNATNACAGVGCHNGTTLTSVHVAVGCLCHRSTEARVVAAIAGHNTACTACHNPMAIHGSVHNASISYQGAVGLPIYNAATGGATVGGYVTLTCTSCHRVNLLADHGTDYNNCPICHAVGGPRSSFSTWDKTCQTGACHPVTKTDGGLPVAPHRPPLVVMDHRLVASGYQAPPYCFQCHNNPAPQCGSQYGCHLRAVPPATSVDFIPPTTALSQISSSPLTWSLTATDVGDGVTATYYSFDGAPFALYGPTQKANGITNPADPSPPYTHTLRYYSVDAAFNTEAIQTKEYNFADSTPPVVTFNGVQTSPGLFYAKSLVLTATDPKVNGFSTGVASIHMDVMTYYRIWSYPYPTPFYQPMADFNYPQNSTWDTPRTVSGVESYAQALTSSTWPTYQDFGQWGEPTSGRFKFQYYATDYANNRSATAVATVYIDNTAPASVAATVTPGVFRWKITATDMTSGVASTYYSFDGASFLLYTSADAASGVANAQPAGSAPGPHTLSFYSVDLVGNTEVTKTIGYDIPAGT